MVRFRLFFAGIVLAISLLPLRGWASEAVPAETAAKPQSLFRFFMAMQPVRILVVEKFYQRLRLVEYVDSGFRQLAEYPCATGENSGKKQVTGDSRTPEGIYFITRYFEDSKITIFGNRAFHLDYPNIFDDEAGRNGNGIYIHGTNKPLIPTSTNGCITMNNSDLDKLAPYLVVDKLPIVIIDSLPADFFLQTFSGGGDEALEAVLLAQLQPVYREQRNLELRSFFYLDEGVQAVAVAEFNVFDGDLVKFRTHSRVYLDKEAADPEWQVMDKVVREESTPLMVASAPLKISPGKKIAFYSGNRSGVAGDLLPDPEAEPAAIVGNDDQDLRDTVEAWRSAWENQDISAYIATYSPTFKNGRYDREGWRKYKESLNKKYAYIRVSISDLTIQWQQDGPRVSFRQVYESDLYRAKGRKTLQLVSLDGKWLIAKEIWQGRR